MEAALEDKNRNSAHLLILRHDRNADVLSTGNKNVGRYLSFGSTFACPIRNLTHHPAEARQSILSQILEPEAADRLGRIRLVKESRAQDVENRLIMLARSGQLRSKVTETQLKELLGAVAETKEEEKIVVSRRKGGWDDDDDLFADL